MADRKLSALPELAATPADDDEVYIRDVSEPAADESKRIKYSNLVPVRSGGPATLIHTFTWTNTNSDQSHTDTAFNDHDYLILEGWMDSGTTDTRHWMTALKRDELPTSGGGVWVGMANRTRSVSLTAAGALTLAHESNATYGEVRVWGAATPIGGPGAGDGTGGTTVVPNPGGNPSTTLTTITIGGTDYVIEDEAALTEVFPGDLGGVADPTEADRSKLVAIKSDDESKFALVDAPSGAGATSTWLLPANQTEQANFGSGNRLNTLAFTQLRTLSQLLGADGPVVASRIANFPASPTIGDLIWLLHQTSGTRASLIYGVYDGAQWAIPAGRTVTVDSGGLAGESDDPGTGIEAWSASGSYVYPSVVAHTSALWLYIAATVAQGQTQPNNEPGTDALVWLRIGPPAEDLTAGEIRLVYADDSADTYGSQPTGAFNQAVRTITGEALEVGEQVLVRIWVDDPEDDTILVGLRAGASQYNALVSDHQHLDGEFALLTVQTAVDAAGAGFTVAISGGTTQSPQRQLRWRLDSLHAAGSDTTGPAIEAAKVALQVAPEIDTFPPAWSSTEICYPGEYRRHDNAVYRCIAVANGRLTSDTTYWENVLDGDGAPPAAAGAWDAYLDIPSAYGFPTGAVLNATAGTVVMVDRDTDRVYTRSAAGTWDAGIAMPAAATDPRDVTIAADGSLLVVDRTTDRLYRHDGTSWDAGLALPTGAGNIQGCQEDPTAPGTYWAVDSDNDEIYHYDGTDWGAGEALPPTALLCIGIGVAPNGDVLVADTTTNRIYRRHDGTWDNGLAMHPSGDAWESLSVTERGELIAIDRTTFKLYRFTYADRPDIPRATQAEAETGTLPYIREFSPLLIAQAIAALAPVIGGWPSGQIPLNRLRAITITRNATGASIRFNGENAPANNLTGASATQAGLLRAAEWLRLFSSAQWRTLTFGAGAPAYEPGDFGLHAGGVYVCIAAQPADTIFTAANWRRIDAAGAIADIVSPWAIDAVGAGAHDGKWVAGRAYHRGETVTWGPRIYDCLQSHTSNTAIAPGIAGGAAYWQERVELHIEASPLGLPLGSLTAPMAPGDEGTLSNKGWLYDRGDWAATNNYYLQNIVHHDGALWRCTVEHLAAASEEPSTSATKWALMLAGSEPEVVHRVDVLTNLGGYQSAQTCWHPTHIAASSIPIGHRIAFDWPYGHTHPLLAWTRWDRLPTRVIAANFLTNDPDYQGSGLAGRPVATTAQLAVDGTIADIYVPIISATQHITWARSSLAVDGSGNLCWRPQIVPSVLTTIGSTDTDPATYCELRIQPT